MPTKDYKVHLYERLQTLEDIVGYLSAGHDEGPEVFELAVKDVLAASPSWGEWQPISNAPKDDEWHVVAKFSGSKLLWWERARFFKHSKQWRSSGGLCEPTHYFPLPPPPAQKGDVDDANDGTS